MDNEKIEKLASAISELTYSTNIQIETMQRQNGLQTDLISAIEALRNVIEKSSSKN